MDIVHNWHATTPSISCTTSHVFRKLALAVHDRQSTIRELKRERRTMHFEGFPNSNIIVDGSVIVRILFVLAVDYFNVQFLAEGGRDRESKEDSDEQRSHNSHLQTPHFPPSFAQCLQYLQFLQALHGVDPVQVDENASGSRAVPTIKTRKAKVEIRRVVSVLIFSSQK
jgi:hypothetical protein